MKKYLLLFVFVGIVLTSYCQTIFIYGGKNHDVYLGCLNCNRYNSESIWNSYGKYGNPYSSYSIWNDYAQYGNEYSNYSPFNDYATEPPVLVDKKGKFYGYFTVNKYKPQQANFDLVNIIYKYYEKIREDVDYWYEKIFEE